MAKQTKLEQAIAYFDAHKDESYEVVCKGLKGLLDITDDRSEQYYRYMVIKESVKDAAGNPLPRIWLKRPTVASPTTTTQKVTTEGETTKVEAAPAGESDAEAKKKANLERLRKANAKRGGASEGGEGTEHPQA